MISNDEKGKSLFAIIHDLANGAIPDTTHDSMLSLLQMEGTDKKLYKYRSFTSEHSLPSLTSNTLYCSKASEFNDPFDCKMGVNLESLISSQPDFQEAYTIWEKYSQFFDNPDDCSHLSKREKEVFEETRSKIYHSVDLDLLQAAAHTSSDQLGRYILGQLPNIVDLLISLVNGKKLYKALIDAKEKISKIIESINPEEVLRFPSDPFALQNFSITQNSDIDSLGVLISLCKHFNLASSETMDQWESKLNSAIQNIVDQQIDANRIGSLCADFKSRLMWAHYANNHRGFCIEYDCSSVPAYGILLPVFYSNQRVMIPLDKANAEDQQSLAFDLLMSIFTKDKIWEYEQEWRFVIPAATGPNIDIPISGIYLGAHCSLEHRNMILHIAKSMSIPVYQMKMDREKYLLHAELIYS